MVDNETIADIIAEARDKYTVHECNQCAWRKCCSEGFGSEKCGKFRESIFLKLGIEDGYFTQLLDRLEAAHRRDRGDAAKLREALKRIVAASIVAKNANAPEWILQRMADIFAMATTALSASPRNCDVGTAKGQAARFFALCNSNKCSSCPCRFTEKTDCALIWAQMPYEEGGAK